MSYLGSKVGKFAWILGIFSPFVLGNLVTVRVYSGTVVSRIVSDLLDLMSLILSNLLSKVSINQDQLYISINTAH